MRLSLEVFDLYNLISKGTENVPSRKQSRLLRKIVLSSISADKGFNKLAFDTRRIDQETDYIPRRGLQNYHRSEKFISDAMAIKIKSFSKLAKLLDQLKLEYGREPEWQDSYTRVLGSAVNKGLRTVQADGDFSECQPSMASLDYLEQLMYVRYRLTPENMVSMSDENLRKAILSKDELLVSQGISNMIPELKKITEFIPSMVSKSEITPSDVSKYSYDAMVEKMMSAMKQVMSSYKPTHEEIVTSKRSTSEDGKNITINIKV
jgi:hypothetical protein